MSNYSVSANKYILTALNNGENILLTGQFTTCWQWAHEVLKYHTAAVRAPSAVELPARWHKISLDSLAEVAKERLFIDFSADFSSLPTIATATAGSLLWLPAATISQALMRYELFSGRENSMMLVPAGLGAVALVKNKGNVPYIAEVNTIVLAEPFYKPQPLLFDSSEEVCTAPIQSVTENQITGKLSEKPADNMTGSGLFTDNTATITDTLAEFEELDDNELPEESASFSDDASEANGDDFEPGWELEMLMANGAIAPAQNVENEGSSDLAASYRLGPPPKPLSIIDAERAAKPGNIVLPPPPATPASEAVKDSFERQFGLVPTSTASQIAQKSNLPRSFQAVLAERQKKC